MRRFILKAPTYYKGFIEVIYLRGKLWRICFTACREISDRSINGFKSRIPANAENMYDAWKDHPVTFEETDFEVSFDDFKREYPYKRNTHLAEAYWPKLSSSIQYEAVLGAIEYNKYCEAKGYKEKGKQQFMKLPDKWLREQQWKNNWRELYV